MSQKRVMKLATRGKRFGAGLIDSVPVAFITIIFFGQVVSGIMSLIQDAMNSLSEYGSYYNNQPYVTGGVSYPSVVMILMLIFLGAELYFFSRSQTIGKAILGLRVVDARTGRPVGFAKMLLREIIVKKASSSVLWLGYIWILIDKYNRGWHDKILDTYVIDEKPSVPQKTFVDFTEDNPSGGDASEAAEEPIHAAPEAVTQAPAEVDDSRIEILQNLQNAVKPAAPETEAPSTPEIQVQGEPEATDESVEIPETPEPEKNLTEPDFSSTQEEKKVL